MSNTSITNVEITDTFQIWISKTNELIDIVNENVMLAGPGAGYTVEGNSTLVGTFTATSLSAPSAALTAITTSGITRTGDISLPVDFFSPIKIASNQENILTLQTTAGARPILRLINGANANWELGQSTTAAGSPFTIRVSGSTTPQLTINQNGNVSVSGEISAVGAFVGNLRGNVTGDILASNGTTKILEGGNGTTVAAVFTGNVLGTVNSLNNHTTNNLAEGTVNRYFTEARARASISASGALSYNASTGVMSITDNGIRALISGGTGVTYNNTTGVISIGQAVATTSNVTFASVTTSGTISANGAITSNADITAFASSSDIRKKENIARIESALDKVMAIGGYTYNFKGDDRRIAGVIAQEIETVLPEVVYEIDDEDFGGKSKAVRYGNIVGLLIEAIKELKAELDEIKGR